MISIIVHEREEELVRGEGGAKVKFKTFEDAANHCRKLIIPEIGAEIQDLMAQEKPMQWATEINRMARVLEDLCNNNEGTFVQGLETWYSLFRDNLGEYWVEWIG